MTLCLWFWKEDGFIKSRPVSCCWWWCRLLDLILTKSLLQISFPGCILTTLGYLQELRVRQKIGALIAQVQQVAGSRSLPWQGSLRCNRELAATALQGAASAHAAVAHPRRAGALWVPAGRGGALSQPPCVALRLSGRRREDGGPQGSAWRRRGRGEHESPRELGGGGGASLWPRHSCSAVPSRWVHVWAQPGCRAPRGVS